MLLASCSGGGDGGGAAAPGEVVTPPPAGSNPILFVTQVPVAGFLVVSSAFGAHEGFHHKAPRGGDLMIRYGDGTLRNLTQEAGFGVVGFQGNGAIAVRQPSVHWNGQKALFSMVVGGNPSQYQTSPAKWQLYEVTGFMPGQSVSISKLPGQPADYNNIAPVYASDGQVIFISDRPRNGAAHLYPQRDEYESAPVDSGLWKLNPATGTFKLIEHSPSGVTYPSVDSAGRVIFTKWDHLLRDQQADQDIFDNEGYGSFNYDSEAQTTPPAVWSVNEVFPELRDDKYSLLPGAGYDGSSAAADYPFNDLNFNHFFPWMVHQDGSEEETLNHAGRHELGGSYGFGSYKGDPALEDIRYGQFNGASYFLIGSGGMFHLREDTQNAGHYYGTHSPEFATSTAGDIVLLRVGTSANAETLKVEPVIVKTGVGRMRNPLPMSDGRLIIVHTGSEAEEQNLGSTAAPNYNYAFRLRETQVVSGQRQPGALLTAGINKTLSWWSPDVQVNWSGTLWELDPVEVRARAVPPLTGLPPLPPPEQQALTDAGVPQELLRNWLHSKKLALVVSRDVTTRDRADQQQPYNLRVPGGVTTAPTAGAKLYDVNRMQFFQADQIRGYGTGGKPPQQNGTGGVSAGRRVLPVHMHDTQAMAANPAVPAGQPAASFPISADGSVAAFVPAQRAMAWQLIDSSKTGWDQAVVRERNWISFVPGETRVCASCHGVNTQDQSGGSKPDHKPLALVSLLTHWKGVVRNGCPATGNGGAWTYSGAAFSACDEGRQYRIQICSGGGGCCDGLPQTQTQACP